MRQLKLSKCSSGRSSRGSLMVEGLEGRQMLSAVKVAPPLITLSAASPGKILAGTKLGYDTVVVHNYTTLPVTESVTATLAPSLDGVNADGAYSTPSVTETITIKKHGAVGIKVPFLTSISQGAGKFHTIATADVDGDIVTKTAPGVYTLTIPPQPTTSPTLIGEFVGLITATSSTRTGNFGTGTSISVKEISIIWETNAQDDSSLTGQISVGDQTEVGTMTGYELTNGVIHYVFASALINYTMDGKVNAAGTKITGKWKGTLVNNIFTTLGGNLVMKLQAATGT